MSKIRNPYRTCTFISFWDGSSDSLLVVYTKKFWTVFSKVTNFNEEPAKQTQHSDASMSQVSTKFSLNTIVLTWYIHSCFQFLTKLLYVFSPWIVRPHFANLSSAFIGNGKHENVIRYKLFQVWWQILTCTVHPLCKIEFNVAKHKRFQTWRGTSMQHSLTSLCSDRAILNSWHGLPTCYDNYKTKKKRGIPTLCTSATQIEAHLQSIECGYHFFHWT